MEELIKQILENKEDAGVQSTILSLAEEHAGTFLETESAKKAIQPMLDKRATQAIETWKNNHLEAEVNKAIKDRGLVETAEQKRLREMEERIAKVEAEKLQATLKTDAITLLGDKQLPTSFASMVMADTVEGIKANINELEYEFSKAVNGGVKQTLGGAGHEPNVPTKGKIKESELDPNNMTYEEMLQLKQDNPKMYQEIFG